MRKHQYSKDNNSDDYSCSYESTADEGAISSYIFTNNSLRSDDISSLSEMRDKKTLPNQPPSNNQWQNDISSITLTKDFREKKTPKYVSGDLKSKKQKYCDKYSDSISSISQFRPNKFKKHHNSYACDTFTSESECFPDPPCLPRKIGPRGPEGMSGCPGPKGPGGERGPRGKQGQRGPEGKCGPQGYQGECGPRGAEGKPGPRGRFGECGPRGPAGVKGPQGVHGKQGAKGSKGDRGERGPEGAPGRQGFKGTRGEAGPCGPAGRQGCCGVPGADGSPGPTGTGTTTVICPIDYCGIGGTQIPPFGIPSGTGAVGAPGTDYIPGIYFLLRGPLDAKEDNLTQLYRSSGSQGGTGGQFNSDPAWDPIILTTEYKYYETYTLDSTYGYIWFVDEENIRERIECVNPGLQINGLFVDTKTGDVLTLHPGCTGPTGCIVGDTGPSGCTEPDGCLPGIGPFWQVESKFEFGNDVKCINIKFNGIGGPSPPEVLDVDTLSSGIIFYLDWDKDGRVFRYTLDIDTGEWSGRLPVLDQREPFFYYESLSGVTSGLGNEGDEGRIWYVDPAPVNSMQNADRVLLIQDYLDLQAGDVIIDGSSGRIFTLTCKNNTCVGDCVWVTNCTLNRSTRLITGCIEFKGVFTGGCNVPQNPLSKGYVNGDYILSETGQLHVLVGNTWVTVDTFPTEFRISTYFVTKSNRQSTMG